MTTAEPAWADTARTQEASVLLEGGGLVNVMAANDPKLFAAPSSLSFGFLDASAGDASKSLLISLSDSGGGAGSWTVSVAAQSATAGAGVVPGASVVTVAPGGSVDLPIAVGASAGSPRGDDYGFIVLQRDADRIRIPYDFTVVQPKIGSAPRQAIKRNQTGTTSIGTDFVDVYRFPAFPFGPPPDYTGPGMLENGAEHVYTLDVKPHAVNAGAAITAAGFGALVEPWLLGSLNEDDVQGYPGTPVNVNGLHLSSVRHRRDRGRLPHAGRYYVVVDSRADHVPGNRCAGPTGSTRGRTTSSRRGLRFLTRRVSAGRPVLAAIVRDKGAGVVPLSLVVGYKGVLVLAALYDPSTGLVVWVLDGAPKIKGGKTPTTVIASDYQESKNVDQAGANILPNSVFRRLKLRAVNGPTVTWLLPSGGCVGKAATLVVAGGSPRGVRSVTFFSGGHRISKDRGNLGVYAATWRTKKASRGRHVLRAVLTDRRGRRVQAQRVVRVCRR
jgi:hypothetical protein